MDLREYPERLQCFACIKMLLIAVIKYFMLYIIQIFCCSLVLKVCE